MQADQERKDDELAILIKMRDDVKTLKKHTNAFHERSQTIADLQKKNERLMGESQGLRMTNKILRAANDNLENLDGVNKCAVQKLQAAQQKTGSKWGKMWARWGLCQTSRHRPGRWMRWWLRFITTA
jgi:regulator of replication initiation timing